MKFRIVIYRDAILVRTPNHSRLSRSIIKTTSPSPSPSNHHPPDPMVCIHWNIFFLHHSCYSRLTQSSAVNGPGFVRARSASVFKSVKSPITVPTLLTVTFPEKLSPTVSFTTMFGIAWTYHPVITAMSPVCTAPVGLVYVTEWWLLLTFISGLHLKIFSHQTNWFDFGGEICKSQTLIISSINISQTVRSNHISHIQDQIWTSIKKKGTK